MPTSTSTKSYAAVLPPPGPSWAGSLMGISLLSSLLKTHGFPVVAEFFFALACLVALIIIVGWLFYRSPSFKPEVMPAWAMLSMGLIALGSASTTIFGDALWGFMALCWFLGTSIGLVAYSLYISLLVKAKAGAPTFAWGLPLVTPMVASTSATQLHMHYGFDVLLWISSALFLLTIAVAPVIFARVYFYYFSPNSPQLPLMATPTSWIPLGMIGQSTAAAQLIGAGFGNTFTIPTALIYGIVMCTLAIPLGAVAHFLFYKAVVKGATYSPTWWASTFPVGTLSLGTHFLAQSTGAEWLDYFSMYLLALMLLHVIVSALAGTIAIVRRIIEKLKL
ncbi:TDT family transporter [Corynebacterium crudilactis]|nr:TDT family transporter [Corynebacterium crudilactis]